MPPRRRRTLAPETVKLNVDEVRDSIARAQRKQAALVVLQGSESEIGTHVMLDAPVTIGRDPKIELPLQDEGISRRHCRIAFDKDKGSFFIEDLRLDQRHLAQRQAAEGARRSSRPATASTSAPASSSSPTPTRSRSATTRRWTCWSAPTI